MFFEASAEDEFNGYYVYGKSTFLGQALLLWSIWFGSNFSVKSSPLLDMAVGHVESTFQNWLRTSNFTTSKFQKIMNKSEIRIIHRSVLIHLIGKVPFFPWRKIEKLSQNNSWWLKNMYEFKVKNAHLFWGKNEWNLFEVLHIHLHFWLKLCLKIVNFTLFQSAIVNKGYQINMWSKRQFLKTIQIKSSYFYEYIEKTTLSFAFTFFAALLKLVKVRGLSVSVIWFM